MLNTKSKKLGFSLIELLVGIAIIITVTTIVLSMIVSTFRISNKTTINAQVRQNGNYALSQVSRQLQFADSFEGYANGGGLAGDQSYTLLCTPSPIVIDHIWFKYQDEDRYITCSAGGELKTGDGTSNGMVSSIDSNKIAVDRCEMTCQQNGGAEGPVVTIELDLSNAASDALVESQSTQNFSTTIKMRNP